MKIRLLVQLLLVLAIAVMAGCGGGNDTPKPNNGTLILDASGVLPVGTLIEGIYVEVILPAGVTVATSPTDPSVVAQSAISVIGAAATAGASTLGTVAYFPATATTPGKLHIPLLSSIGFAVGDFVSVHINIAAGVPIPSPSDFPVIIPPNGGVFGRDGTNTSIPLNNIIIISEYYHVV